MESSQQSEQSKKRRSCFETIVFAVGGIFVVFIAIAIFTNQSQDTTARSTSVSTPSLRESPTDAPTPSLTFAQWKNAADTIPYETLLRQAEQYEGEVVYFRGRVALIPNEGELWVYVARDQLTGSWNEEKMVLRYRDALVRVLEDDMVSFVAIMDSISAIHQIPELTVIALEIE